MADSQKAVPPEPAAEAPASPDLNFEEAELIHSSNEQKSCRNCSKSDLDTYYVAASEVVCSDCADVIGKQKPPEPGVSGLLRALLYGAGAAVLGTVIYYAVLALTGYEIGFLAVIVGWLVGRAVRKGGKECGGWKLQTMAVALTYCSIIGSYVPLVIKSASEQMEKAGAAKKKDSPAAAVQPETKQDVGPAMTGGEVALAVSGFAILMLAMPFLAGSQNILGIFIIGLGLFEAWRINRRPRFEPAGPFFAKTAPTP